MRIEVASAAERELGRLSTDVAVRVERAIDALADDPRPAACRLLPGDRRTWGLRVRDWRVLYEIDDSAGIVRILRVLHRSKAYRRPHS
jgi:mRNA interferase RelE/StbE